jgi:hypothetical protein
MILSEADGLLRLLNVRLSPFNCHVAEYTGTS